MLDWSVPLNLPSFKQLGSFEYVKSVPEVHVTSLLPLLRASESEHSTVMTVPGTTGNCVVVFIELVHPVFSPVQPTDLGFLSICPEITHTSSIHFSYSGVRNWIFYNNNCCGPIKCVKTLQVSSQLNRCRKCTDNSCFLNFGLICQMKA